MIGTAAFLLIAVAVIGTHGHLSFAALLAKSAMALGILTIAYGVLAIALALIKIARTHRQMPKPAERPHRRTA